MFSLSPHISHPQLLGEFFPPCHIEAAAAPSIAARSAEVQQSRMVFPSMHFLLIREEAFPQDTACRFLLGTLVLFSLQPLDSLSPKARTKLLMLRLGSQGPLRSRWGNEAGKHVKPHELGWCHSSYGFIMSLKKMPAGVYTWHVRSSLEGLPGETVPGFAKEAHREYLLKLMLKPSLSSGTFLASLFTMEASGAGGLGHRRESGCLDSDPGAVA